MFDMEDLLKKVHMLWDLNNDINNRSNIIKEYIEKVLSEYGIDSNEFLLYIVEFSDDMDKKYLTDTPTIVINSDNMNGELSPLLSKLNKMIYDIRYNRGKKYFKIDSIDKEIKKN